MTKAEKFAAVIANDGAFDTIFYYAVKTTGIFCRPSCKSKPPLEENILFFDSAKKAEDAGFRPCKRCRPDMSAFSPIEELAEKTKAIIDERLESEKTITRKILETGVSRQHMDAVFKAQYGLSISEYINKKRTEVATEMLLKTNKPIVDIAYDSGFESISSFYRIFSKNKGKSPGVYRKNPV